MTLSALSTILIVPVSKSWCSVGRSSVPFYAIIVQKEVSHLTNKEVTATTAEWWSGMGWKSSDKDVSSDWSSEWKSVGLGEYLVSDCHADSVVEDGYLNIGPDIVAQNSGWEIGPAAVSLSVNKQSGLKLRIIELNEEGISGKTVAD